MHTIVLRCRWCRRFTTEAQRTRRRRAVTWQSRHPKGWTPSGEGKRPVDGVLERRMRSESVVAVTCVRKVNILPASDVATRRSIEVGKVGKRDSEKNWFRGTDEKTAVQ